MSHCAWPLAVFFMIIYLLCVYCLLRGEILSDLLIFSFFVEIRFHHVGQAGLELLILSDPPASASQSAGIQA